MGSNPAEGADRARARTFGSAPPGTRNHGTARLRPSTRISWTAIVEGVAQEDLAHADPDAQHDADGQVSPRPDGLGAVPGVVQPHRHHPGGRPGHGRIGATLGDLLSYPCATMIAWLSGRSVRSPSPRISMLPSRKRPRQPGPPTAGGWLLQRERSSPCVPDWPRLRRTNGPRGRSLRTRSPRLRLGLEMPLLGVGEAGPDRAEPLDGHHLRRRGTGGSRPR